MSTAIPTNLLKLIMLAEVPRSIYMDAPACDNPKDEKKRLDFLKLLRRTPAAEKAPVNSKTKSLHQLNAALWLRFPEVPAKPVGLFLVYRDQKGEFGVMVDEVKGAQSLMLSGNVTIEARGPIEYLYACCTGIEEGQRYVVDELYVQKVPAASATNAKGRSA